MQADYVTVGAGSAGCVPANRLTEDRNARVVLIEAGGRDWHRIIHIPAGWMNLLDHPKITWGYKADPDSGLNGRVIAHPRGKVLDGSSLLNGMIYIRGQPEDFNPSGPGIGRAAPVRPYHHMAYLRISLLSRKKMDRRARKSLTT